MPVNAAAEVSAMNEVRAPSFRFPAATVVFFCGARQPMGVKSDQRTVISGDYGSRNMGLAVL